MDRRTLLRLGAAAVLAGCARKSGKAEDLRIVVAGAGIVGASIAYHLAKAGVRVTVIDKQGPASHASRGTFAWINATWAKQPRHYHAFSAEGVSTWRSLQESLGLPVRWGGSLEWFDDNQRQDRLRVQIAEQVAWSEPARMVGEQELRELEPNLKTASGRTAAYSPNDGAVDPILATRMLLDAAQVHGAEVIYPCELMDTVTSSGRLHSVRTSRGIIQADRLVLATGAARDSAKRFADIDIPQRSTPGFIALTKPMPRIVNRIVVAPGVHMHQRDDGRLVLGEQDGPPKTQAHALRLEGRPNDFPARSIALQHGNRILETAKRFVTGLDDAEIDAAYIGWRPLPIDGHPVLGVNPDQRDVYIAIMHSGVSLAPIVAQLVTHELVADVVVDRLERYRPTRSFTYTRRY